MRERIDIWKGYDRINWLCLFMREFVKQNDLMSAPLLLSGYYSIQHAAILKEHQLALYNIRWLCHRFSSQTAIRKAVVRYNEHHRMQQENGIGDQRLFSINEKSLEFSPINDILPPEYYQAHQALLEPLPFAQHDFQLADTTKSLFVEFSDFDSKRRYSLDTIPEIPAPSQHTDNAQVSALEIEISISDLCIEAREMDVLDKIHQRRAGNWELRLQKIVFESPTESGDFSTLNTITLAGLKHLIGLPGSGKTTLLMCLTRWLSKKGYKTAVFFPSVEVSRQYLTMLQDYEVSVSLLMGRSDTTRARHAHQLAESIASGDELHGFGKTMPGAEYFSTNCVLPAFTSAADDGLKVTNTYCHEVQERNESKTGQAKFTKRLCPLWSKCGYHKAARELTEAHVWLGHIASCDTQVPLQTTEYNQRYFEMIARDFDVVIFDEADQVQTWLDEQGVSRLTLTGDADSFHADLQKRQNQMTVEHNYALGDPRIFAFTIGAIDFSRYSHMLVNAVQLLDQKQRSRYEGLFLTPARIISALFSGDKSKSGLAPDLEDIDSRFRQKDALCQLWESSAINAFYNRQNRQQIPIGKNFNPRSAADNLGLEEEDIRGIHRQLSDTFRSWLTEDSRQIMDSSLDTVQSLLAPLINHKDAVALKQKCRLLMAVTFTILSYRRLAPHSEALVEQGFLKPSHVEQRCSDDFLKATPENILGSLSGVRFFLDTQQFDHPRIANVRLQYVVFAGSPRAYMYHLHRPAPGSSKAPAVLMASATSFLEQSPAYHIDVLPDYIAKARNANRRFESSRFYFNPIPDPARPGAHLRYSGASSNAVRESNLKQMVHHLLKGGIDDSIVGQAIQDFDAQGRQRKAALVVNSYQHCELIKQTIDQRFPEWAMKSVAVVKDVDTHQENLGYITSSQVEALGDQDHVKIIIFPMGAIGRGTNIVFTKGDRRLDAAIGTIYFLTRPHPSTDDLSLLISLAAKSTESFNQQDFSNLQSFDDIHNEHHIARKKTYAQVGKLLRNPLMASRLGDLLKPFTANCAVNLLQTIGRGMRNGCPVQCVFVDAAWARHSANSDPTIADTPTSSMLVQLIHILRTNIQHHDPRKAAIYRELYEPFLLPLEKTKGLRLESSSTFNDPTLGEDYTSGLLFNEDLEIQIS